MDIRYKKFSKNIIYFFIGSFFPKAITFFLIPFYTSILTPSDYGLIELISVSAALALPVFTLDIQDAVLRFVYDSRFKPQEVLSVALFIILKGCIIIGVGCIGLFLFNIPELKIEYLLFFAWQYVIEALQNSINMFCKGIGKVRVLTVSSIIQSLLNAVLCIYFLFGIRLGLIGYLLSGAISTTVSLVYVFVKAKLFGCIQLTLNNSLQKEMIAFSFPLIFSVIAWWINNSSDRYIIAFLLDVSSSGLYGVSYKIPTILTMLQTVVFQAWSLLIMKEFNKEDKDGFLTKTFIIVNTTVFFFCSLLVLLNLPLARFLYSGEFYNAWLFVPPLLASVLFNSTSLFVGSIFTFAKKTRFLSYTTILGALINIIFNFILIKYIGLYGAALATMLGYLVVMILRLIFVQQLVSLHLNWRKIVIAYVVIMIQVFVAYWGNKTFALQLLLFMLLIINFKEEIKEILRNFRYYCQHMN